MMSRWNLDDTYVHIHVILGWFLVFQSEICLNFQIWTCNLAILLDWLYTSYQTSLIIVTAVLFWGYILYYYCNIVILVACLCAKIPDFILFLLLTNTIYIFILYIDTTINHYTSLFFFFFFFFFFWKKLYCGF
jgi:hypothetical protein